eukprot:ANDGO_07054.mRNA.1 CRAL-TRIO domain-containing protein C23B6.04c
MGDDEGVQKTGGASSSRSTGGHDDREESDRSAVRELRERVADELDSPALLSWCTDMTLRRFLIARKQNVQQAHEMLSKCIAWRREFKPEETPFDAVEWQARSGKNFICGRDDRCRPVIVMRCRLDTAYDRKIKTRFMVFQIESAIRIADADALERSAAEHEKYNPVPIPTPSHDADSTTDATNVAGSAGHAAASSSSSSIVGGGGDSGDSGSSSSHTNTNSNSSHSCGSSVGGSSHDEMTATAEAGKMVWVVDLDGYPWSAMFHDTKIGPDMVHIMQNYYPERLGRLLLVRPMFVFWGFWKILSPFVDKRTSQNIVFLRGSQEAIREKVVEELGEKWTVAYFDTVEDAYHHDDYWNWMVRVWPGRRRAETILPHSDAAVDSSQPAVSHSQAVPTSGNE